MFKRAYDLHQLAIQLIENEKPGIYTTDPIPHPKFEKNDNIVLCPYCSTSHKIKNGRYIEYYYVNQKEFAKHIVSKEHVREFVNHHMMQTATDDLINKMVFILNENFINK